MPPVVVLDVNVLRNEALVAACIASVGTTVDAIAVPEMALFELTRHPNRWASTVRASLKLVARCPEAVVLTRSSKPVGLAEEATGVPTKSMVNPALSEAFRRLLGDVGRGEGPDLDAFLRAVQRLRGPLDHEQHAKDSLQLMQKLRALGHTSFAKEDRARIGGDLAHGNRTSFRELLRATLRIHEQRNAHVRRGVADHFADALLDAPSVSYLFALAVGALALEWVFLGGVDSAAPGRVANDILDIEYMLAALWSGRLVSADARARARLDDLKQIGADSWPTHAAWFHRANACSPEDALSSFLTK